RPTSTLARASVDVGRAALGQVFGLSQPPFPGVSGSPALAADGTVLGVVHASLQRGVSRVIPASTAWRVATALAERGSVARPYLGAAGTLVRAGGRSGEPVGLMIVEVDPESGAGRGGLKEGDVVLRVDGKPIPRNGQIMAAFGPDAVGSTVELDVLRGGDVRKLLVTIGQREGSR
ncbi:MAG TPA: S1C family serine protease, partial [Deinococcales bacterium]|nr:S1C family serine protease [Deinococcales bacterium]